MGFAKATAIPVFGESATGPGVRFRHEFSRRRCEDSERPAAARPSAREMAFAGLFDGHVRVARDLSVDGNVLLANADCAEDFDLAEGADSQPGTVMVVGDDGPLNHSSLVVADRAQGAARIGRGRPLYQGEEWTKGTRGGPTENR